MPRTSQVHQILSQGPAAYAQMTQLTRQYSNALVKPTPNSGKFSNLCSYYTSNLCY